jgi:hypothetical protein
MQDRALPFAASVKRRNGNGGRKARTVAGKALQPFTERLNVIADSSFEMSVMVMEARPKPGLKKIVEERDESGLCLLCDRPALKRGLCTCHYGRWRTARAEHSSRECERLAFDAKQIRDGKLLPNRNGQPRSFVNEYRS